jgi:hypothetical protein
MADAPVISKARCRELAEQGDREFKRREPLLSLWQEMALNFMPMRADFTSPIPMGEEFASHLMTGRPLLAQRDLGNAISSMLRPRGKQWVHARTMDDRINTDAGARQSLDAISERLLRIFNFQDSGFVRATKQGDNDFTIFGQCVLSPDVSRNRRFILYRSWHLRDTVWCENAELKIKRVDRDWVLEAVELKKQFGDKVSSAIDKALKTEPYRPVKCRHIVLPADEYDLGNYGEKKVNKERFPFVSIYIDRENDVILEELPRRRLGYIIPRWVTPSGTQYAHSPATVVGLPEARLLQQITLTLLESGQKSVDPPMKATREAIAGGVNLFAGGVTWVDAEYDERLGGALEPIWKSNPDLRSGELRAEKIEQLLAEAFYLNKIALPTQDNKERTMYEVSKLFDDYVRGALPLFEPLEVEYNGALCEETFHLGMDNGAFSDVVENLPAALRGQDVVWNFESPLQAAAERAKSEAFVTAMQLLTQAVQIDPAAKRDFDVSKSFRDAVVGSGAPSNWIVPQDQADAAREQDQQMEQAMQAGQAVGGAAQVAQQVGAAGQQLQQAGMAGT